jgi:hypothetical protein
VRRTPVDAHEWIIDILTVPTFFDRDGAAICYRRRGPTRLSSLSQRGVSSETSDIENKLFSRRRGRRSSECLGDPGKACPWPPILPLITR